MNSFVQAVVEVVTAARGYAWRDTTSIPGLEATELPPDAGAQAWLAAHSQSLFDTAPDRSTP